MALKHACGWMQLVGPILAEPAKKLPSQLSNFLEEGTANNQGAVYVSMGSAARLAEAQLHSMAQGLSGLPNPVLWKLSSEDLPGMLWSHASHAYAPRCNTGLNSPMAVTGGKLFVFVRHQILAFMACLRRVCTCAFQTDLPGHNRESHSTLDLLRERHYTTAME